MISLTGRDQFLVGGRLNIHHATRYSMACIANIDNSNVIELSGLCIDGVEECGQANQGPDVTESLLKAFRYAL
jgi:hypothetical protein